MPDREAHVNDENRVRDTVLDLFVFGPLGLAVAARDELPGLVRGLADRGRRELGRRRDDAGRHLRNANAVGRFTVATRGPKLREKIETRLGPVVPFVAGSRATGAAGAPGHGNGAGPAVGATPSGPPRASSPPGPAPGPASGSEPGSGSGSAVPAVELLAIPDYDELSASQVVQRLAGLNADELDAVRRYESAQRARQTILGRIAQLSR